MRGHEEVGGGGGKWGSFFCLFHDKSRVPTAQGKQGKWPKKIPGRENTGNLEILSKHREFRLLKL